MHVFATCSLDKSIVTARFGLRYYDGQIRSGIAGASRRPPQGIAWPVPEVPVTFLPVAGQELSEGEAPGPGGQQINQSPGSAVWSSSMLL